MKKYLMILFSIFFSTTVFASLTDYNKGKTDGASLKSQGSEVYSSYLGKIKECSRISGNVYHPGDSRLPLTVCHYTLGLKDGYYGTSTSLSACTMPSLPSDISISSLSNCSASIVPSSTCNSANINIPVGNTNASFALSSSPNGTTKTVDANNNGQSCGTNAQISCKIQTTCNDSNWLVTDQACNCVSSTKYDPGNDCVLPAPQGRTYCRCAKWVSYETWKRTYEC